MNQLPFRFSNSAGWPKTLGGVDKLCRVPLTTHVVIGSYTVNPRPERGGGTDFDVLDDGTASNNRSLPNGGLPYLCEHGLAMVQRIHDAGKKAVLSGSPFSAVEDGQLAMTALDIGFDEYESNRSCPNTEGSIIAYMHELMLEHDAAVYTALRGRISWWRKVAPYANPRDREIQAEQTAGSSAAGLVACNTFPGSRLRRDGVPIINATGTNGLGGLSGTGIRYVAQLNAEHFCELLAGSGKEVIGVGGVSTAEHAHEYLSFGCVGIQVGAALFKNEDPDILQEIGHFWALAYAKTA